MRLEQEFGIWCFDSHFSDRFSVCGRTPYKQLTGVQVPGFNLFSGPVISRICIFNLSFGKKKKAKKCQTLKSTGNRKFDMDGRKKFDVAGS